MLENRAARAGSPPISAVVAATDGSLIPFTDSDRFNGLIEKGSGHSSEKTWRLRRRIRGRGGSENGVYTQRKARAMIVMHEKWSKIRVNCLISINRDT